MDNIDTGISFCTRHGFKICIGAHYLCGFIGDIDFKRKWLIGWKVVWEKDIGKISKSDVKYPQESYTEIVCTIQSEWIFLQQVTKNTGFAFSVLEDFLRKTFCLAFYLERRTPPPF